MRDPSPPSCLFYILFHNKDAAAPSRWGICAKMALRREGPMPIRRLSQQLRREYKSVHSETGLLIPTGVIAQTAEDEVQIGWAALLSNWIWRLSWCYLPEITAQI